MPETSYSDPELDSLHGEDGSEGPKSEQKSIDQEEQNYEQTVVPMKVLTGPDGEEPNEGDEIVVKVVAKHGTEATIAYAPSKKGMEHETEMKHDMSSDDELDALSKE